MMKAKEIFLNRIKGCFVKRKKEEGREISPF